MHVRLRRVLAGLLFLLATSERCLAANTIETFDPEQYRGKVVLLDFWASWCGPCKESFPWMQQLQEEYAGKGLVVIAVNVDHDRHLAEDFLRARQAGFTVLFDPRGQVAERFHVSGMPSSFYIDRQGAVRYSHTGFRQAERDAAERELAALVDEK